MLWMCIRIASPIHNILFYGEILKFFTFYHFDPDPRFPPFLLYVRWKSGVTFVQRCIRDVPSPSNPTNAQAQTGLGKCLECVGCVMQLLICQLHSSGREYEPRREKTGLRGF